MVTWDGLRQMFKRKEGRIVKKLITLALMFVVLAGGLVGCGEKKDTGTKKAGEGEKKT
jgi:hypothetical protein